MDASDDFDADALFEDGSLTQIDQNINLGALQPVSLPATPLVVERILNLQHSGCLNRVVWAKTGVVASVADDGTSVNVQCLRFNTSTMKWGLTAKERTSTGLDQISSLAWSPLASDLAVVDIRGRLSLFRPGRPSWNRIVEVRSGLQDDLSKEGEVIGLHWLGQERPGQPKEVVHYAYKKDTKWHQHRSKANQLGPLYHRSVVLIDRNARLSVLYERTDGSFRRVAVPLIEKPSTTFSHAACAPTTEGKLLVALHSHDGTISAHWVTLDFTETRQKVEGIPTISTELATRNLIATSLAGISNDIYDPSSYNLTHLGIIPSPEIVDSEKALPTIYAIYASCDRNTAANEPGYLAASVVHQWTVSPIVQALHPRFNELSTKSSLPNSQTATSVVRCPDKHDSVIATLTHLDNRHGLFATYADGRSEFLRIDDLSHDLSPMHYSASDTESSNLAQSHFAFPLNLHPSHTALSPSNCVIASIDPDADDLALTIMDFAPDTPRPSLDPTSPASDVALAAINLAFSRTMWTTSAVEDLLAMILHTFTPSFCTHILTGLYRTLFRETEFISEHFKGGNDANGPQPTSDLEKAVQKPALLKVFSFHYGVSLLLLQDQLSPAATNGTTTTKITRPKTPTTTNYAFLAANLRFTAQILYMQIREMQQQPGGKITDMHLTAEALELLCANIRWICDLFRWMIGYILDVRDRETHPDFFDDDGSEDIAGNADGSQGLVPLLINCHWTRQMLLAILRALKRLHKIPEPWPTWLTVVIQEIQKCTVGKGFGINVLEAMLVPQWVVEGDRGERDASVLAGRQVAMMCSGVVAEEYKGTIQRVAGTLFENMRQYGAARGGIDKFKIWVEVVDVEGLFMETEVDGKGDGDGEGKWVAKWDVHKKKRLRHGVKEREGGEEMIKTCVRCGRCSEDVMGPNKGLGRGLMALVLRCVCDAPMVVERWDTVG